MLTTNGLEHQKLNISFCIPHVIWLFISILPVSYSAFLFIYSSPNVSTLWMQCFQLYRMSCGSLISHLHPLPWFVPLPCLFRAALGGPGGLSRGEMTLTEVQCHLDKEGASDLVIDLIMNTTSDRVFQESILLAIALLEGGNTTIQVSSKQISLTDTSTHI